MICIILNLAFFRLTLLLIHVNTANSRSFIYGPAAQTEYTLLITLLRMKCEEVSRVSLPYVMLPQWSHRSLRIWTGTFQGRYPHRNYSHVSASGLDT